MYFLKKILPYPFSYIADLVTNNNVYVNNMSQGVTTYGRVVQTALFLLVYSRTKCRQIKYIVILSKEDFVVIVIYAPINNIKIKKNHCNYFKILMNNICSHRFFLPVLSV